MVIHNSAFTSPSTPVYDDKCSTLTPPSRRPDSLFVVPNKVPQTVPVVGIVIDVRHAALQAGLELRRVLAEEVHDHGPTDAGKHGPGVVADGGTAGRIRQGRDSVAGLHGQPREGEHDPREDIDDDLLVHARDLARPRRALSKDDVAAEESSDEGIIGTWRRRARTAVSVCAEAQVGGNESK